METSPPVIITRKATRDEVGIVEALQIRIYKDEGYLPSKNSPMMGTFPPYNDATWTDILVACVTQTYGDDTIIGTISLTENGPLGFPIIENDFPKTITALLDINERIALIWRFVIEKEFRSNFDIARRLIWDAVHAGKKRNVTRAICVINPKKHEVLYRDYFGFTELDRCANMSGLINAPGLLLTATVSEFEMRYRMALDKQRTQRGPPK